MQVILIGSGNVAMLMGKLLHQNGHRIVQVYSRNEAHAITLANAVGADPVSDLAKVKTHADLYLIAVTDDALPEAAANLRLGDKLVIHTAGSVSKEVLKDTSTAYGVLWPIKMIRASTEILSPATLVIDGNTTVVTERIREIAAGLSVAVTRADDATRVKMHMIATLTANFSNHLYQLAADYCAREGIRFADFFPLLQAAVQNIHDQTPRNLQAGPAFRGDRQTIEKHRQLLENDPQVRKVYDVLTESIGLSFLPHRES